MPNILLPISTLIIGFALLIWSANTFTENGAKIANILRVQPLIIGLIIFGFGTSAPEMLVSALAAMEGNTNLGIGNAIGSNIFNIALVLGISAIIMPIKVPKDILKKEWVFLIIATIIAGILLFDGYLGRLDGVILLALLVLFIGYTLRTAQQKRSSEFDDLAVKIDPKQSKKTWALLIIGLLVLIASAKLVVWSGVSLAQLLGVSELIIGLSVIALGTSLPELAVSISSAIKNQHAMVIGNIIGSNLFNTVGVLAIPGLIHPAVIPQDVINRDYPIMLLLSFLLFVVAYKFHKTPVINRFEGGILTLIFVIYMGLLF